MALCLGVAIVYLTFFFGFPGCLLPIGVLILIICIGSLRRRPKPIATSDRFNARMERVFGDGERRSR